jgi:hypothetical protein
MSKIFSEEIIRFYNKLINGKKFAFSKYADGEWIALKGQKGTNNEWTMNDGTNAYDFSRDLLWQSFTYKDEGYYIGISCPCCQGQHHYDMLEQCKQDSEHVTYANLFVNSNYTFFIEKIIPFFKDKPIHLVANKCANIDHLPFSVERFYPIQYNAWLHNLDLINEISTQNLNDKYVLFSAGPLGNILCHQLWNKNKNNTYIDIGSTIDPWTKANQFGRYYTDDSPYKNKVCIWS